MRTPKYTHYRIAAAVYRDHHAPTPFTMEDEHWLILLLTVYLLCQICGSLSAMAGAIY